MIYRLIASSILSVMFLGLAAADDTSLVAPYVEHLTEAHGDVVTASASDLPAPIVEAQRKLEAARKQLVNAQKQVAAAKTKIAKDAAAAAEAAAKAQAEAAAKVKKAAAEKALADAKAAEAKQKAAELKANAEKATVAATEDKVEMLTAAQVDETKAAPESASDSATAEVKPASTVEKTPEAASSEAATSEAASEDVPAPEAAAQDAATPEAAKSSLQDPVIEGGASVPPAGKWNNFNTHSCGAIACDVAGGCDMPGGCSVLRNRPLMNGIKNRIQDLRRPISASCESMGCDGCDSPGNGCQLLKKMHDRFTHGNGPIRNAARSLRCDAPGCDAAGGCDTPGGCNGISFQDGPVRRMARSIRNCGRTACAAAGGCDLPGGCGEAVYCDEAFDTAPGCDAPGFGVGVRGGMIDRLHAMKLRDRRPIRNMVGALHCDSGVCDSVGGCDQLGGRQVMGNMRGRIRDRLADGPVRQMIRSHGCAMPGCDMAGGCDMPGGCGMGQMRRRPGIFSGLLGNGGCSQDPGVLFYWSSAPSAYRVPGLNQAIVTDRPDFTEASSVVGLGVLQMELGYTYTYNDGPNSVKTNTYPETLLRYGIYRDWLEFRFNWSFQDQNDGDFERDGADDMQLGFKFGLTAQHGILPEMALITQMRLPTGASNVSRDEVLPGVNLIYGWTLSDYFSLAGSTQFNRDVESTGDAYTEWAQSVSLGYALTDRLGGYTEYFGLYPNSAGFTPPENYLNSGITYLISNDVQWDFRYGVGLSDESDDYFVGTGLSFRLR